MKKAFHLLPLIFVSVLCLNFVTDPNKTEVKQVITKDTNQYTIVVNFEYGESLTPTPYSNIYVIWMEDSVSGFIQNMKVCYKLTHGGLTGTALPFWKVNKLPISSPTEVDAVTSATIANSDFTVSSVLKDSTVRRFVVYFEIDRSFEPNDWFSDQPALLYKANIDLDNPQLVQELYPLGWTPNEGTQNIVPNTPMGFIQKEMRHITHHKVGNTFGTPDPLHSSTRMVERITVTVVRPVVSISDTRGKGGSSISLFPNPTSGLVNIKSNDIINKIEIINIQGQTILCIQPKKSETSFILDKHNAPTGLYYAKITTSKGVGLHKILITE